MMHDRAMSPMSAPQRMKRDLIFDDLRRRILSGQLPRGSRMPQDELARQFGASITPVREALRLLEAERLVVSEPHRGVRVAGFDIEKVKGIYVVRRLTESYAMRRAISRLTRLDLCRLREAMERMRDQLARGDLDTFRSENRDYHFFFYDRCGLSGLRDQIDVMWQAFPWDLMLNSPERGLQSHREHEAILAAVEAEDADAVAAATELHIAAGFAGIARSASSDGPVDELRDPYLLDVD
jgi:DNA-binding GntR family transcriptional regulator